MPKSFNQNTFCSAKEIIIINGEKKLGCHKKSTLADQWKHSSVNENDDEVDVKCV